MESSSIHIKKAALGDHELVVSKTVDYVKKTLFNAESGHNWYHIERVWKTSLNILNLMIEKNQEIEVNVSVLELGALLHDIGDHKFTNGDLTVGPKMIREHLNEIIPNEVEVIEKVLTIVEQISFKGGNGNKIESIEGKIVQDADRLDALGAIGIARTFAYGGYKNREIYDPNDNPKTNMTWDEYKNNKGSSINHFYEKLLLLKDLMNTEEGKQLAEKRHVFMEEFLKQFYSEWNCEEKS